MRNLLMILTLTLLVGCSRKMLPVLHTIIKDSVVYSEKEVVKRDTIYKIGDTVTMQVVIPCSDAKLDTFIKKGKTSLTATIHNGLLNVDCKTDSLQHLIDSITRIKEKVTIHTEMKEVGVAVIKNKVPAWCWWLIGFNVLAIAWKLRFSIIKLFGA